MVRYLIALVFLALLLTPAVCSQAVHGKVTMKSGRVLIGRLIEIREDRVKLRVPEGTLSIARSQIASLEEIDPRSRPRSTPLGQPSAPLAEVSSETESSTSASSPAANSPAATLNQTPGATPSRTPDADASSAPDAKVGRLVDRYLWFIPQNRGHRITLGAALFLCLILVVQLSTRMANLEGRTIGKSFTVSVALFIVLALEIALTPPHPEIVAGICTVNVVLWVISIQAIYQSGIYRAVVMLVSFIMASMVGVLSLEVMGFVLHRTVLDAAGGG